MEANEKPKTKPRAKSRYIDISELRDSREVMEAKPHFFFTAFSVILFMGLVGALIWMYFGAIDVYIKATGVVRPNESISVLRSVSNGKLQEVNIADGQTVSKGDILYTIDKQAMELQLNAGTVQRDEAQDDLMYLEQYRTCIDTNTNTMDQSSEKGRHYALLVEKYLLDRQIAEQQITENLMSAETMQQSASYSLQSARNQLNTYRGELTGLQNFKAILQQVNNEPGSALTQAYISDIVSQAALDSKYKTQLERYLAQLVTLSEMLSKAETAADQVRKLYEAGATPRQDYDNAQTQMDTARTQMEDLKQSQMLQTEQSIADTQRNVDEMQIQVNKAQNDTTSYTATADKPSQQMMIDQGRLTLLAQINNEIRQKEDALKQMDKEIEAMQVQISDLDVIAPIDGVVNLLYPLTPGDLIQAGLEIGSIVPLDSDSFKVTFTVSNKDIANVKIGQQIKCKFLALPYQEYGSVEASVLQISSDARADSTGNRYYMVEASLENKPIKSYKGRDETIKVGMLLEGQVVSDTKTILRWALEKMNFT